MSVAYVSVAIVGLPDCFQSRLPSVEIVHLVFCVSTVRIINRGNLFFMDYFKNSRKDINSRNAFLSVFPKLRTTISFVISVRLSDRNTSVPTGRIFL